MDKKEIFEAIKAKFTSGFFLVRVVAPICALTFTVFVSWDGFLKRIFDISGNSRPSDIFSKEIICGLEDGICWGQPSIITHRSDCLTTEVVFRGTINGPSRTILFSGRAVSPRDVPQTRTGKPVRYLIKYQLSPPWGDLPWGTYLVNEGGIGYACGKDRDLYFVEFPRWSGYSDGFNYKASQVTFIEGIIGEQEIRKHLP